MKRVAGICVVVFAWAIHASFAEAQGTRAEYERSNHLAQITQGKVHFAQVNPHWSKDGNSFWYRNDGPDGTREFIWVDATIGSRQPAFDHEKLAITLGKQLGKQLGKELDARHLPIDAIEHTDKPGQCVVHAAGKRWLVDLSNSEVTSLTGKGAGGGEDSLPKLHDLHPSQTGEETTITFVNHSDGPIKLIWVDTGGQRVTYGSVDPGKRFEQNTYAGHVWVVTDAGGKQLGIFEASAGGGNAVIEKEPAKGQLPPGVEVDSPVTQLASNMVNMPELLIRDYNVFIRDRKTGAAFALTTDGRKGDSYSGEIVRSPDGSKCVILKTLDGDHRKVYVVQSSPTDQLQPRLESYEYLKPGDRIPMSQPHLFDLANQREIHIDNALFLTPWDLSDVRWEGDSSRFTFFYNRRGHQALRIIAVDAETGKATPIINEESKTFIDYAGKMFVHYLDPAHEIIWMSERDGWNHLYLYDSLTGKVKNQITKGEWVVRKVNRVDEEHRQIWFEAGGIRPGQDPYYVHYCRVNFDGTGMVVLTEGDGSHKISYSPDQLYFIDTYSRMDMPPVNELRRSEDGKMITPLEKADMHELLATGWQLPERFVAKGRDGKTDIYGVIYKPIGFDATKKYPVIEDIYAGPQDSFCPKSFARVNGGMSNAQLGFIIVQIDGMGTSNRSKAFHDVCWRNLGDAGFPDRIAWIKAAAVERHWMDITRVGIYGTSAGGQDALRAVEAFGDFYKAAVSDCGCHDNRMDKIWWNELWMGWPIGPWYAEQSNVTNAKDLHGALLLIVGETDHNVDPASTMQVVNALIKADKDFDLLVIPNADHGQDGEYGNRRRKDFFVRHLLGVEPRAK